MRVTATVMARVSESDCDGDGGGRARVRVGARRGSERARVEAAV